MKSTTSEVVRRIVLYKFPDHEPRVPHISPDFGEMWELTEAGARVPVAPGKFSVREQLIPSVRGQETKP
jgi:hypothetical protein